MLSEHELKFVKTSPALDYISSSLSLYQPKMFLLDTAVDSSSSCEIRAVIRFLRTKNTIAKKIRNELCAVCSQFTMSK
jgi:hypothetical protein